MKLPGLLGTWALICTACLVPASVLGRQQSYETPSLGALARQLREERAKQKQRPVPLYTNDDLPASSVPRAESEKPEEHPPHATMPSPSATEKAGEKYFRSKAQAIRSRLELHQRQLTVLEQQWGLSSLEYYPNPQKTLQEESTPTFHADISKLRNKIEAMKQQIADDKKALADLKEELRRKGGDPGWIRQ